MVNDSRWKSISEAILNIGIGFWINMGLNATMFPFFGLGFDLIKYLQIGGFYTITSLIRQYPFRRLFNRIWKKQPRKGSLFEIFISDIVVGYTFNWISSIIILPFFGISSLPAISFISMVGTLFTFVRRYFLRRLFNVYGPNETLYTLALRLKNWLRKLF